MPLDPSIVLRGQAQPFDALEAFGKVQQVGAQMRANRIGDVQEQELRRAIARRPADEAAARAEQARKFRREDMEDAVKETGYIASTIGAVEQAPPEAREQAYQAALGDLQARKIDTSRFPQRYDPGFGRFLATKALTAQQQADQILAAEKLESERTHQTAVLGETTRHNTVTETTAAETAKGVAADRAADNARAEAAATEAARHNRASEAISARGPQGPQPAWQWVMRNGVETYTNRVNDGDKPQNARVKATEDERKTAGFYGQMSDSIKVLDELEGSLSEKELYQIQTLPQEGLIGMANRGELSESAKRYLRAFEQFTEARLRPVSGAAISDSEFARDRRTYARQFSETPKLKIDRQAARFRALDSLKKRAGVALDDANEKPDKTADPLGIR